MKPPIKPPVLRSDVILTALKDAGLLPDNCGDLTISVNLNEEPRDIVWFTFRCWADERHLDAIRKAMTMDEFWERMGRPT